MSKRAKRMSSNNPDEKPSLPVQNEMKCCNCDKKSASANETQFQCCPNGHTMSICAKCYERGIQCPICKAPLVKIKVEAEDHNRNQTGTSTSSRSKVGKEENEDSDGLKGGTGDAVKNSKKKKHDDSAEAKDSQNAFIESGNTDTDTKDIVFKVINDDDNSSVSVTKNPGADFSITSTSTPAENKTSRISFSFPSFNFDISKMCSSVVSNLGTIQFGSPVVGNSSTATIQTAPSSTFTFGNAGSNGGIYGGGGGDGGPSVYDRGATIWRNNSTFTANGAIINGSSNNIVGNGNVINGSSNKIAGNGNVINGSSNKIAGNTNTINGSNNQIVGNSNEIYGSNNNLSNCDNRATGYNNQ